MLPLVPSKLSEYMILCECQKELKIYLDLYFVETAAYQLSTFCLFDCPNSTTSFIPEYFSDSTSKMSDTNKPPSFRVSTTVVEFPFDTPYTHTILVTSLEEEEVNVDMFYSLQPCFKLDPSRSKF